MKFIALDFETANASLASICQIGVVAFDGDRITDSWETLVDPEDEFDFWNTSIHGIEPKHVSGAPTFPQAFQRLAGSLTGNVVVHHTPFDRVALARAVEKHKLTHVDCLWLDSAKVVRRAWPEYARSGYGLSNVARELGINFNHHAAQEDARAAGEILRLASQKTGLSLTDWLARVQKPISPTSSTFGRSTRDGDPEGHLFGEVLVFTGALTLVRSDAANMAAQAGCKVADNVTSETTLLVVGDQDLRKLAGSNQSSKHRKAITLQAKGIPIRILSQSDFEQLILLGSVTDSSAQGVIQGV